ncbi:MAG: hypothetical protein R2702_16475 [Acidimicrobiales bacterium]
MTTTSPLARDRRLVRRLAAAGVALGTVLAAAACEPAEDPDPPTPTTGQLTVVVAHDGDPVDARVSVLRAGDLRTFETGADGTVTLTLPAGTWGVSVSADGEALPDDPLCWRSLVADPIPAVAVAAGQARDVAFTLEAGPLVCA